MGKFDFAFFWHGPDTRIPECLVRSIRLSYGGSVRVFQMGYIGEPAAPGIDRLYEFELPKQMMLARARAAQLLQIEAPTIFIDADMILLGQLDLPEISDREICTVTRAIDAIADGPEVRQFPEIYGKSLNSTMPFVGCFLYTRSRRFLNRVAETMEAQPEHLQRWFGDQLAIKEHLTGNRFKSVALDPSIYNHALTAPLMPQHILECRRLGIKILHAKSRDGKLKRMSSTLSSLHAISAGHTALSSSGV